MKKDTRRLGTIHGLIKEAYSEFLKQLNSILRIVVFVQSEQHKRSINMKFAVGLLLLSVCIMHAQCVEHNYGDVSHGVVLGMEHVNIVDELEHPSYEFTYPKVGSFRHWKY